MIAMHDPVRFASGAPDFLTNDEESPGIIPAFDILGPGWFLLDVQAHAVPRPPFTALQPELVEDGQYLAMYVPQTDSSREHGDDDDNDEDDN